MSRDNGLSMLDANQVIQDVHNEEYHALDVITANSLVPKRFGKVELEYITSGNGVGEVGAAKYYSEGAYQSQSIVMRGDTLGTSHKTVLNFYTRTPQALANTYFVVYDVNGAVTVWFNLDNGGTQPSTDSLRFIAVNIASTDTEDNLAQKLNTAVSADTYLSSIINGLMVMIINTTSGVRKDSVDYTSGLVVKNIPGTDRKRLDGTYFLLNSALNADQYYVWYNVAGGSTDPLIAGKTAIQVNISLGASVTEVVQNTEAAIAATGKFLTNISGDKLIITNTSIGTTTPIADVNCNFPSVVVDVVGANRSLIAHLVLSYDTSCKLISVERL